MKSIFMLMVGFLSVGALAFAGEDEPYKVFQDGEFRVEYPDWKQKKPSSETQVLRVAKGSCSVVIDVYPMSLDGLYGALRNEIEKSHELIRADPERHELEYKIPFLFLKVHVRTKYVSANDKTYAVSFAGLGGEYKKKLPIVEHVLNSAKSSGISTSLQEGEEPGRAPRKDEFRYGLYRVKRNGSGLQRLYANSKPVRGPKVSPDGKKVVFYVYLKDTNGDGVVYDNDFPSSEIAVVNLDGTGFELLTENQHWDVQPNWSRDGQRILFASNRDSVTGYDLDLFSMDLHTRAVKNITNTPEATEADPDCQAGKVVFTRFYQNKDLQSIWIMDEDGSTPSRVSFPAKTGKSKTGFLFGDFDPTLTHDGSRLAFVRLEGDRFKIDGNLVGDWELYAAKADGSEAKKISDTPFLEGVPEWSPDGKEIAFIVVAQSLEDRYRVYVSDGAGKNRQKVLKGAPIDFLMRDCSWFPQVTGDHPDLLFVGEWFE